MAAQGLASCSRGLCLQHQQPRLFACRPQVAVQHLAFQHRRDRCVRTSSSAVPQPEQADKQQDNVVPTPLQPQQPQQPAVPPPQQQVQPQQVQQQAPQQPKSRSPSPQRLVVAPKQPNAFAQQQKQQSTAQNPQNQQAKQKLSLQQRFSWLPGVISIVKLVPASLAAFMVGGMFVCTMLWGWAKGSPIRKNKPYTFTMTFTDASKLDQGTPVRMKGVQIGQINKVTLQAGHLEAVAEVCDSNNLIPVSSRVDLNLLGLASDPWIDITPPVGCLVRRDHGPHHPDCAKDGLVVCNGGQIKGHQGGSSDYMMKFFLNQHDRAREKTVDVVYHNPKSQQG